MTRQVSDWDFFGGDPKPDTRFTIIGTIAGSAESGQNDPEKFPKWFLGDMARPVWWCPGTSTVAVDTERPQGAELAVQIAVSVRFEEETCDFDSVRFFYNGPCDPFTDDVTRVPAERLRELGVFLLPSNRQWDRLLSFGSSSFLKPELCTPPGLG